MSNGLDYSYEYNDDAEHSSTCICPECKKLQWLYGQDELSAQWPDLPDLDGQDIFSHLPISGSPAAGEE